MRIALSVTLLCLLATPALAQKEAPKKTALPAAVQEGYALIYAGKIDQALAHFRTLNKEMPGNKWSKKAMRPLLQAVQLEKIIARKEHPKWVSAADWLHRFYTTNKVPTRLLALSERAHARFPKDAKWATRYANVLAEQGKPKEALAVWKQLTAHDKAPGHFAMAAILAARVKEPKQALALLGKVPADCEDAIACYNAACAYALLKDTKHAGAMLQRAFEQSPPSKIHELKRQAMFDADLENLNGSDAFASALAAESKVKEPTATPSGCEGCPSKGSCSDDKKESCGDEKPEKKK